MVRLPMQGLWLPQGETIHRNGARRDRTPCCRLQKELQRTLAVHRDLTQRSFVFDQGFGFNQGFRFGNVKDMGPTDMSSLFRIADVTMPITSVAIFTLIEQGKLNLTDKVFGASGILGTKYGKSPYGQYVTDITVDHLLTHTCGGWPADSTDPMYKDNSWDQAKLIGWTLENLPLANPPGEHWAFSNFGYCLLGRVIEQITGQPYAGYVQSAVLAPCGISGMRIAGNSLEGARTQRSGVLWAIQ